MGFFDWASNLFSNDLEIAITKDDVMSVQEKLQNNNYSGDQLVAALKMAFHRSVQPDIIVRLMYAVAKQVKSYNFIEALNLLIQRVACASYFGTEEISYENHVISAVTIISTIAIEFRSNNIRAIIPTITNIEHPLYYACRLHGKHIDLSNVIAALLDNGAILYQNLSEVIIHKAPCSSGNDFLPPATTISSESYQSPLSFMIRKQQKRLTQKMLGMITNYFLYIDDLPLPHALIKYGLTEELELLKGKDVLYSDCSKAPVLMMEDQNKKTPLAYAIENNSLAAIKALQKLQITMPSIEEIQKLKPNAKILAFFRALPNKGKYESIEMTNISNFSP